MPSLMKARSGVLNSNIGGNALAPLFSTGSLTTANLITDVTRLAGVQGDGAAYPNSGVGVWPAATNLVTNGNATTNTTAWTAAGTATLARVTDDGKFGTTCFKWTIGATPGGEGVYSDATVTGATTGRTFTISRWVKGVGGSVGKTVRLVIREVGGASGTATVAIASFTLTSDWQLCSVTGTVVANDRTVIRNDIVVGSTGTPVTTADEVKFSGVSTFESAINMPYIETDGGTASRSAGSITMPASVLDETQMWVAGRLNMPWATEPVADPGIFTWADDVNNRMEVHLDTTGSQAVTMVRGSGGSVSSKSVTPSWSAGDDISFAGAFYLSGLKLSANGSAFSAVGTTQYIPTLAATVARLGDRNSVAANRLIHGSFRWFAAGKGTLTDADAALFHSWGNNDPLPHQFPRSAQLTFLAGFNGDGTAYRYSA